MSSRLTVGVLLFGLSAVAVVSQQPGPAAAQAQKKNTVALLGCTVKNGGIGAFVTQRAATVLVAERPKGVVAIMR